MNSFGEHCDIRDVEGVTLPRRNILLSAALLLTLVTAAAPADADPRAKTTKGFVVTRFVTAMYEGETGRTAAWDKSDGLPECPDGFAAALDTDRILDDLKVPAAERAMLKRPENHFKLGMRLLYRGASGADVCDHPESAPDPGFAIVKGKIAYGLNLDGADETKTATNMCSHENFVGPNGEPGIDNQLYRALGCIKGRRQGSFMHGYYNAGMRQGDYSILIEVLGVDDPNNDDDVKVGFYAGQDPLVNNVDNVSLTYASLRVHHDRHYRAMTAGKIVNGVLTTEPVDVLFKSTLEMLPYRIRDARLRAKIQADGSLNGTLGGYQDIRTIFDNVAHFKTVAENEVHGPMSCPGLYYALRRLADAYPDPAEGGCTWISSAYEVDAVPAFVIHPKEDRQ